MYQAVSGVYAKVRTGGMHWVIWPLSVVRDDDAVSYTHLIRPHPPGSVTIQTEFVQDDFFLNQLSQVEDLLKICLLYTSRCV